MKPTTFYIADDGTCFADEKDCREHERKLKEKANSAIFNEYRNTCIVLQNLKSAYCPYRRTLPMLQNELLIWKRKYLAAKKYGVNASKAKRFARLAVLQYKYFSAKAQLAYVINFYRLRKAHLRELGKKLGFKSGEEVSNGK